MDSLRSTGVMLHHADDVNSDGCHSGIIYGIISAMKAAIDAAGRIVVPKLLRDALGLKPGQPLEIRAEDGRLEIAIAPTAVKLKKRGKGLVAVPDAKLPPLTADLVRDTLERTRR
jgi:AbrB family looped-hinge helix DNA binding protein